MKSLKVNLWIAVLISAWVWPVYALEEALGNPSTAVSSSVPTTDANAEKLLAAALQLRKTKPALFDGAQGVLIVSVFPDSQAAEKGLRPGDIVIAYAGELIDSVDQLIEVARANNSQSRVVLRFIRREKVEEIELRGGKIGIQLEGVHKLPKFWEQIILALQTKDSQKILQLIRDNPESKGILLELFLDRLAEVEQPGEDIEFLKRFTIALQSGDSGRILQIIHDNSEIAKKVLPPDLLTKIEQLHPELDRLIEDGGQAYSQAKYLLAIEKWQTGLERSQQLKNKHYISQFLGKLGFVYLHRLDQYSKSLECYEKASVINKEIGNYRDEGSNLNDLGLAHFYLGQYSKALESYEEALVINKEIGSRREEGRVRNSLAIMYYSLGQYSEALNSYLQSLIIAREIFDRDMEGSILGNIGSLYRSLNQYPMALSYQLQSLIIFNELGNKSEEGKTLNNIGNIYYELEQYSEALSTFQRVLSISKEFSNKTMEGATLGNIGGIYKQLGQYHESLEYFQQALSSFREIGNRSEEKKDLANICIVYIKLGQYLKALNYCQKALSIAKELNTDDLWKIQTFLAFSETHLNQLELAINHYDEALNTLETLRANLTLSLESSGIIIGEIKTKFMEDKFFVYDDFITLLQSEHSKHPDRGYDRKAFEIFEKKQGRVFLEQMGKSTARRFTGVPEEITSKDRELENQVVAARKKFREAYAKDKDANLGPFRQHLEEVEKAQQDFEEKLKTEYETYYALKYPKPVKLDDLQKNVLQADEITLIYNVREKSTDLWLVSKQHFQMFSLPLTEAQVTEQVAEFRKWAIDRVNTKNPSTLSDSLERDFPAFAHASHTLYQQLFPKTVRKLLAEAKPKLLYIVPTSALYELPFEALITENTDKPRYLLEDYAVSYLSSASLLKTLRDAQSKDTQSKEQSHQQDKRQPLLAFADPVYPPCANKATTDMEKGCFTRLHGSADEAKEIAKLLNVDKNSKPAPLQLREAAAKSTVFQFNDKQQLDKYQYILFSTHAILPNEVSFIQQPAIVLSHTQPTDENGFLTMGDVFGLSINTDLVMLSACNTGLGGTIKGEGTIGLTRAFMYAGTPAVAITLWSVEINATKALNVGWFNRLQQKQPLAESLRQAKLAMLNLQIEGKKEEYYRYPYAWAGIVVFGDGK